MPVEAERLDDEGFELPGKEIRQEESCDVIVPAGCEIRVSREERVAMRTRDARHPFLFAESVDKPAGAAIGIGDEDALETVGARPGDSSRRPGVIFSGVLCQMAGRQLSSMWSSPLAARRQEFRARSRRNQ